MASGAVSDGPSTVADQFSIRVCVAERGLSAVTVIPVSCSWAIADIIFLLVVRGVSLWDMK